LREPGPEETDLDFVPPRAERRLLHARNQAQAGAQASKHPGAKLEQKRGECATSAQLYVNMLREYGN